MCILTSEWVFLLPVSRICRKNSYFCLRWKAYPSYQTIIFIIVLVKLFSKCCFCPPLEKFSNSTKQTSKSIKFVTSFFINYNFNFFSHVVSFETFLHVLIEQFDFDLVNLMLFAESYFLVLIFFSHNSFYGF